MDDPAKEATSVTSLADKGQTEDHPFRLPSDVTGRGIGLRVQDESDADFLRDLYLSTRWDELAIAQWPAPQKAAFLTQQFTFQAMHYDRHYPDGDRWILCENGAAMGRLFVARIDLELRIVDIALLPSYRGQGIGSGLLAGLCALAQKHAVAVGLHVGLFNPARRLYDRSGFLPVGDSDGVYQKMEWRSGLRHP